MDLRQKVPFFMNYCSGYLDTVTGNGSITLPKAKANGLKSVKLFGGTEQRNLPKGYTQLDYITFDGSSYIDTGLTINNNTRALFDVKRSTSAEQSNYPWLGGVRDYINNTNLNKKTLEFSKSFSNKMYLQYATSSEVTLTVPDTTQRHTYDFNKNELYIDENLIYTATQETFTGTKTFLIGAMYLQGIISVTAMFYGDVYEFKLWQDGTNLSMDLIPAKRNSDNVIGMYDLVSGNFLTNQGTGSFIAGYDTVPTPDYPMDIISNNGAIKYSANMANVNEQTALIGYYISSSGVVTADANNWIYQDYIPVEPNTTYTLTMSSSVYYVTISEYSTADDSGFITRKAGSSGDNTTLTITTSSTANYIRFGTNIDRTGITLDRVLAINWMLNVGDTMAYQPYVEGGIYTDGTVETVQVTGKNIFDKNTMDTQRGWYVSDTSTLKIGEVSGANRTIVIDCKPNTKYSYWHTEGSGGGRAFDMSKDTIAVNDIANKWLGEPLIAEKNQVTTYTTSSTAKKLYILAGRKENLISRPFEEQLADFMVVEGEVTSATPYEPYYNGGTATAEMLLKVGEYKDIQSVLDGGVTRNIGVLVLDGVTTGKMFSSAWNATYKRCNLTIPDMLISVAATQDAICNSFPYSSSVNTSPTSLGFCTNNGYLLVSFIGMENITSANDANTWLASQYNAGTPVIVVYPLATPTAETVTPQTLQVQVGTNILQITQASIDNLQLEATYKRGK